MSVVAIDRLTVSELLASVGARTPTPGGGAVAAVTAALAAALGRMVLVFSSPPGGQGPHEESLAKLEQLQAEAVGLADEDAEAFTRLSQLWKLPADDPQRRGEWEQAVEAAIEAPRRVMLNALATLALLAVVAGATNRHVRSDLAMSAILAETATRSAAWNVRINLPLLGDASHAARLESETDGMLERAGMMAREIERAAMSHANGS